MKHNNLVLFAVFFLFAGMSFCLAKIPEFSIQDNYLKAKDLFEKGLKNLYLCTGYRKEDLQKFPWIKEILPKNVDFENFLS